MAIEGIYNFIAIDERIATGGQPTADQLRDAADAGFAAVINLAPDGLETSLPGERELVGTLGMKYHHIPVPWTEPSTGDLAHFAEAMDATAGGRVLVHCQANFRVTAFFGLYAMDRLGWDAGQADALMERVWNSIPGHGMNETWQAFIAARRGVIQTG